MKYNMINYMYDYDYDYNYIDGIRLTDGEEKEICIRSFVCVSGVERVKVLCRAHHCNMVI